MLFGHQNDVNQPQPDATDQGAQNFVNPADQPAQTVAPQDPVVQDAGMPQDPVAQDVGAPQDPAAGVNPLAVDPATGASLPAVPQNSPEPVDTPISNDQEPVLDQPSSFPATEAPAPEVDTAPDPGSAPTYGEETASAPDPGAPFSASPAPVLDESQETQEASAIAGELDTPGEENSTVLTQDPASDAPAADPQPADPTPGTDDTPTYDSTSSDAPADDAQPPADNSNSHLLDLKQQAIAQLSPLVGHLDQGPEEKFRTTMMLLQSTDNPALLHDAYTAAQAISDEKVRAQALLDVVNEINYFTQQGAQSK